jgi:hypothetical protein
MGKSVRRPRVDVTLATNDSHGFSKKRVIVLHQTISPDVKGFGDISGVGHYLDTKGYGIHVITDIEGNSGAVPEAYEEAVFYHASSGTLNINTWGIGIEQISYKTGNPLYWWKRARQLHKTARWCAYLCKKHGIKPVYDPTCVNGICGHADVTRQGHVAGGHTDCEYPDYPTKQVARLARNYMRTGWA